MYQILRQIRAVLAVVAAISVPAVILSACNPVEHRSEAIPKKKLQAVASRVNPRLVWASNKGSGAKNSEVKLRLALVNNALISADAKGAIFAQDRNSGEILWETSTKTQITAGPTIIGDRVLVGTKDKGVYAFDITNGKELWKTPLSGEVLAAPQGSRDMVFVHAMDGSVAALSLSDGHVLWRQSLSIPPIVLHESSSPAVENNRVFVGFSNGRLMALDQQDGSLNWEHEVAIPRGRSDIQRMADISADPIVRNGIVYVVSYQGRLAALKADSGTSLWERDMSSYAGFTLDNSAIYVSDARGSVIAVDRKSGKTLWEQDGLQGRRLSRPSVVGNTIAVGDEDGFLHWLSAHDGTFLSRTMVDSKGIEAPPLVQNNMLYVLGRGGKVAVYTLEEGSSNNNI